MANWSTCRPIKAYWTVSPAFPHTCIDEGNLLFAASVINIFTDFLATAIPIPLIWSLKLPTRQRLAVISIFGLGIMVNVAGSFRTVYVWESMVVGWDRTWLSWPILIAASVEINLGLVRLDMSLSLVLVAKWNLAFQGSMSNKPPTIKTTQKRGKKRKKKKETIATRLTTRSQICSSAPALRPLVAAFLPRLLGSSRHYNTSNARSRSQKPWTSTARSQQHLTGRGQASQDVDLDNDRFEIMRTVEMETWSESRIPHHENIGHTFDIGTEGRARSPNTSLDLKNGPAVFSSAASDKSSSTLSRDEAFYGRR